jgi:hypothetical protein
MQTVAHNAPAVRRPMRAPKVVALVLLLLLAGLLWRHAGDLDGYRRYWLGQLPAASVRFNELSATTDEAALQKHLAGVPLRCISEPRERNTFGDRACSAGTSRLDDTPVLTLAAFFDQGRLVAIKADVPWWAHHTALRQLVAQFGAPEAIDPPAQARPVVQWRTRSGRVALEKTPGFDPLQPVTLQWRADAAPSAPNAIKPRAAP